MLPKEYNWLLSHPEIETKYAGEYIAIIGESIAAHGKNFKEVVKDAKKNKEAPYIYKVQPLDKALVV